jgi:hypothetical protein
MAISVSIVILLLSVSSLRAECLPRGEASVDELVHQVSLTQPQADWLRDQLADNNIRSPQDLWECPEADDAFVDVLEDLLCWGTPFSSDTQMAMSSRGGHREAQSTVDYGSVSGVIRYKKRNSMLSLGGGIKLSKGYGSLLVGQLRQRVGMGLLLSTVDTKPRGRGPIRFAENFGAITTSELAPKGIQVAWNHPAQATWISQRGANSNQLYTGLFRFSRDQRQIFVAMKQEASEWGVSISTRERGIPLALEIARFSNQSWSWGATYAVEQAPWALRGSLLREAFPQGFGRSDLRWNGRYSFEGGTLRGTWGLQETQQSTVDRKYYQEVEVSVKPFVRWSLKILYQANSAIHSELPGLRVLRLSLGGKPDLGRVLFRWEQRTTALGTTSVSVARLGMKRGQVRIELRGTHRWALGKDPSAYLYRRRPGLLFDLERAPLGSQWGVWLARPLGPCQIEGALDLTPLGIEGGVAFFFFLEKVD